MTVSVILETQRHILITEVSAIPVAWVEGFFFYDNNTFMKVWLAQ